MTASHLDRLHRPSTRHSSDYRRGSDDSKRSAYASLSGYRENRRGPLDLWRLMKIIRLCAPTPVHADRSRFESCWSASAHLWTFRSLTKYVQNFAPAYQLRALLNSPSLPDPEFSNKRWPQPQGHIYMDAFTGGDGLALRQLYGSH